MASKKKKKKKKKKMSKTVRKMPKLRSRMAMEACLRSGAGPHTNKRDKRGKRENEWKNDLKDGIQ